MREDWLEKRKHGIGGSDIAVIMGHSKFKSPYDLFLEKTQNIIEPENFNMRRGSSLEPTVIKAYLQVSGDRLVNHRQAIDQFIMGGVKLVSESPMMFESTDNPIKKGSPDGLILSDERDGLGVLEAKAPSAQVYRRIKREGLSDSWIDQVQWYMNILKLKWAAVAVFSAEYWELQSFIITEDLVYQENLVSAATHWWKCIETNTAPNVELNEPEVGLKGQVVKVNDPVWWEAGEDYLLAKEAATQATARLNQIKGRLRKFVGNAYCVEGNGFRVFRKPFRIFNYKV